MGTSVISSLRATFCSTSSVDALLSYNR